MIDPIYDLLVLGAGPGGYVAAVRAAELGLKVAVVDDRPQLGGVCLHEGCIPSKALLDSSFLFVQASQHLQEHGIEVAEPKLNLEQMMARKQRVVDDLGSGVSLLFKNHHITHVVGRGALRPAASECHRVEVVGAEGTLQMSAKRVLLATGSQARQVPTLTVDGERIITAREALSLAEVPQHLLVVGAGAIGLEVGSLWQRLGAKVSVVEMLSQIAPSAEPAPARALQKLLQQQGLGFYLETRVERVELGPHNMVVQLVAMSGEQQTIECDRLLVAIGRQPNSLALGLKAVGLAPQANGQLAVDDDFQTAVAGIYALGDLVAGPMLAHKASAEALVFAERLVGRKPTLDYRLMPNVIYTHPELAMVGLSTSELKRDDIEFVTARVPFKANGRAHCCAEEDGYIELYATADSGRLLGVTILGALAAELINLATTVLTFGGSALDVARCCHAHPSLGEAFKEAAMLAALRISRR